uniref:Bacteriophage T5 Orf172 DNA-binding domain-containing protein n=1 Tax=mine drainage metagenome TaxID=410659 RepID=E6QHA5_9ZZZZ
MTDLDLDVLASELAEFAPSEKKVAATARQERIIAGFAEIQRFVDEHGRAPQHGEDRDIFERLYAARLDRLRAQEDCRSLLAPLDRQGLLAGGVSQLRADATEMDVDALFAELDGEVDEADIATLHHVRSSAEKREAEEIASRTRCEEFSQFKPLFERVKNELSTGVRTTLALQEKRLDTIKRGQWFVIGGQVAYVADDSESFETEYDRRDSRLRVVYDNGTESNVLARSLQRALHRDPASRVISDVSAGPLFADVPAENDVQTGTVYVLRSKSENAFVAEHREVLHKIGVTGNDVKQRIANAENDPTFLMASVEVIAEYKLFNIDRVKLENIIHRVFAPAQLDVAITDRFGKPVQPREWFLVPEFVVGEAVERIKDGTITEYVYDPKAARLVHTENV